METQPPSSAVDCQTPPAAWQCIAYRVKQRNDDLLESEKGALDERKAFTAGSYWDATVLRTRHGLKDIATTPGFVAFMLLYIFLLGYWLIINGRMQNPWSDGVRVALPDLLATAAASHCLSAIRWRMRLPLKVAHRGSSE